MNTNLALLAITTLLINIPCGFWRESVQKFSAKWFVAVHAAVPIVITLRLIAGIEWQVTTISFLVFCYFLGQFIGARLRRQFRPVTSLQKTSFTEKT